MACSGAHDEGGEVLVVDDDRDTRELLSELLELLGYRARPVSSGQEALAIMTGTGTPPRLVLLDLVMPRMNGLAVRAEMRRHPRLQGVPVVALTGLSTLSEGVAEAKFDGVLQKPVGTQELRDVLERFAGSL